MAVPEFTTDELEHEEWRPVVGHEGRYLVSSLGRVMRTDNPKYPEGQLLGSNSANSYRRVGMVVRSKRWTCRLVHKLVAEAFLGPCPQGMEVNHKDLDKGNPRLDNLEYVTHQGNIQHAARYGRMRGNRGPRPKRLLVQGHKLTAADVVAIRRAILDGIPGHKIAASFRVTFNLISIIKRGRAWSRVTELQDEVRTAYGEPWVTKHRHRKTD